MNDLEVAEGADSPEIEFVFAAADVARGPALATTGVRLAMLDWDAFAEVLSACGGCGLFAQPVGDFEDCWLFHLAKEHERTHASRYANGEVPDPLPRKPPQLRLVK